MKCSVGGSEECPACGREFLSFVSNFVFDLLFEYTYPDQIGRKDYFCSTNSMEGA
jgi:hypothetical protein